jgi:tRNA(Arg) A34 adenosine deaminase TadA
MKLTVKQRELLKKLMVNSARKGNLANSGLVLEGGKVVASAESLVVTNRDQTAHSERLLVEEVCKMKGNQDTPELIMVSVVEPCLMCLSACSQAGYKEIAYIIPAKKYVAKIPWMTDIEIIDKSKIAGKFSKPIKYTHLAEYEDEFCRVFEEEMSTLYKIKLP